MFGVAIFIFRGRQIRNSLRKNQHQHGVGVDTGHSIMLLRTENMCGHYTCIVVQLAAGTPQLTSESITLNCVEIVISQKQSSVQVSGGKSRIC